MENSLSRLSEPIDVVYTWVDGSDPAWRRDFEHWLASEGSDTTELEAAHPSRYRSRNELRYSLRSLWLNAGWVRRIFLVTAGHVPDWLVPDDRLTFVHHGDILPSDWLPTFNSHAIEARLHHIDGLAEHFLYLNDDVYFGRALPRTAFFTPNGLARFFESEARIPLATEPGGTLSVNAAARNGQRLIREVFGRAVGHKLLHAPHALRRSVLFEIEGRFPEEMEATARARFRNAHDLSIASAFAHHYGFCTGASVPGELNARYLTLDSARLTLFLTWLTLSRALDAFCLNDTEAHIENRDAVEHILSEFLASYFPHPSPWERK